MSSAAETLYPLKRKATLEQLSPSIHWAQAHTRTPVFQWSRRIYDFEMLYVQHGEILALLGDQSFQVPSGTLLYIPSGVFHSIQVVTEPDAAFLGIHFDFFDELDITNDEDIIVAESRVNRSAFCREPVLEDHGAFMPRPVITPHPHVVSLMEFIIQEFTLRNKGYMLACKGLLLQLFACLLRSRTVHKPEINPKYENRLRDIVRQIDRRYMESWDNERIAGLLNIHADYMIRFFRDLTGTTPNKYIQSVRLMEAKRLLRETDEKIESVSRMVGYEDFHYFSRVFHKWEGISPREYRNLSRML